MTDQQVRDEVMTIFLAGHETTANALAWTWYLVSQSPDVEARLHQEVDRVLAGRTPTVADIPALGFVEHVVTESMRLYPPAYIVGRRTLEWHRLDEYDIPPRALVVLSPYLTQRQAAYFPDPERFAPDRWTPEFRAAAPAVRLLSLWRRHPPVHRRIVRVDGARARRERSRAAVAPAPRTRLRSGSTAGRHAPVEARPADDGSSTNLIRTRPSPAAASGRSHERECATWTPRGRAASGLSA